MTRVPWRVSLLSLLVLLPVGFTVFVALRAAWDVDLVAFRVLALAYAALGVVLMMRRVGGVVQEARTPARRSASR